MILNDAVYTFTLAIQYTYRLVMFTQQGLQLFESTELHSLLAVEGEQRRVSEHAQLMLPVSWLGEVIGSFSTATLLGVTGVTWVDHQLCCDHRLIRAGWTTGGRAWGPCRQGMAEGPLQVGDGHVLAHGGQSQVHIWPPMDMKRVQNFNVVNPSTHKPAEQALTLNS